MSSQTKLIKDILSLYDTILENKEISEAMDVYDNVDFKNIGLGNPSSDDINTSLLRDVQTAAKNAGVKVDITTAISGHSPSKRHNSGNAVDIAMINGKAVSPSNREDAEKLVSALVSMGYTKNSESGDYKSVLTFGFPNHDTHVHVSHPVNGKNSTSSDTSKDDTTKDTSKDDTTTSGSKETTYDDELTPDPLVMSWAKGLTNLLGIKEEKIYGNFGDDIQNRYGSMVIPKDTNPKIKSPVSGTITHGKYSRDCNNRILLKHKIDGETYYLEYCGISNPSVKNNTNISKGDVIGNTDSDVKVSLYSSSNEREHINSFVNKEVNQGEKKLKPNTNSDNETVIAKLLQLPFKPFQNVKDDKGNIIKKRWGSSTEKQQPEPWFKKMSPTYNPEKQDKKLTENIIRIKGLLK